MGALVVKTIDVRRGPNRANAVNRAASPMSKPTTAEPTRNPTERASSGRLDQSPKMDATINKSTDATIIRSRVKRGPPSSRLGVAAMRPLKAQKKAAPSAAS